MSEQHTWGIVEISAFDPVARVSPHERLKDLRETGPTMRDGPDRFDITCKHAHARGLRRRRAPPFFRGMQALVVQG